MSGFQLAPPKKLILTPQGLRGTLTRTKTSGTGRSLGELFFYFSKLAYLAKAEWLKVGLDICCFLASEKDFLVQCSEADWSDPKDIMAEYADLVSMSLVLDRDSQLPVLEKEGWVSTQSCLLVPPALLFWTEHSERNAMTTLAALLGCGADDRELLGR